MASFTDNTQALSTFNPYVAQQPVDAMVKVGMQKQQQYEEGYQKIQSSIDQVAGLDIMRDVDKGYLQSKLNSLGTSLRTVAAGDFSNFQLTNSVAGMAKKLGNDPTLQKAVSSTARVRKEIATLEDAKKAGKASTQNEWDLTSSINGYINNGEVGASFTGQYTQYTNMDEKLRKVAKDIHESDLSYDNPFVRDAAGNTLYFDKQGNASTDPSKGSSRQDPAMLSIGIKEKSAEKILNTFYSTLSPDDMKQLSIDGRYHYKDANANTFQQEIVSTFVQGKKVMSDGAVKIALEIQTNAGLTSAQKAQYTARLNEINTKLTDGSLDKEMQQQLAGISSIKDIEGYKASLYTKKYLTNLSSDLAYEDKKMELKSNPYEQANDRRLQLQLAYNNSAKQQAQWAATFNRDERHWQADYNFKVNEAATKAAKEDAKSFTKVDPGAKETNVEPESLVKLGGEITAMIGERNAKGDVIKAGQLQKLDIGAYSFIPGVEKMDGKQKESYLNNLSAKYATNPGSIEGIANNPNLRKYLESRRTLEVAAGIKQKLYNTVANLPEVAPLKARVATALKTEQGIVDKNGRQIYSATDLYEINGALKSFNKLIKNPSGGKDVMSFDGQAAVDNYKGTKFEPIARAYAKQAMLTEKGYLYAPALSNAEQTMISQANRVTNRLAPIVGDVATKTRKLENEYLTKYTPERQTMVGTLNTADKGTRASILGLVGNKVEELSKLGAADVNKKSEADQALIQTMLGSGKTTYTVVKNYDGSANLMLRGKEGEQTLPLTAAEVANHFPAIAVSHPLTVAKNAINSSVDHSTNLFHGVGEGGAVSTMFSGYDLPQLRDSSIASRVRYDVEGDPSNDGGADDGYTLKMYVQPKGSNVWISGYLNQNFVPLSGIQGTINLIGNETIDSFLTMNKK
jgi:hypothetical protein